MDGLTLSELSALDRRLRDEGRPVTFAFDGLVADV
jgi:hypothetical protein